MMLSLKDLIRYSFILSGILVVITACSIGDDRVLPYVGVHSYEADDTIYYRIPEFSFLNQDSLEISSTDLEDGIYVADFFYTYCPTICPIVKTQMLRIYEEYKEDDDLKLISFALDPKRDNVSHLNLYANNLGVSNKKWNFLTGDKELIWDLAEDFLISVNEDENEPGGIFHSGKIVLIDSNGHIRGFADGTEEKDVNRLMTDIKLLLKENGVKNG